MLGTAVPVDPGDHLVEVSAPGKKKWSKPVDVRPGAQIVVELPELEADSSSAASGVATSGDYATSSGNRGSSQKIVAAAVGGVGVVGLVLGSVFGLKASSNWSDAKSQCTNYPNGCSEEGVRLGDDAKGAATVSTIGFAVGVAGIAGGAILWFTAPSGSRERASADSLGVGFDGQKFVLRGAF